MSDARDLIRAILLDQCADDAQALAVLETALEREVDILVHCATAYGLSAECVMERAVKWSGFGFYPHVPSNLVCKAAPTQLEALADIRMFRVQLLDREIAFASPDFHGLIRLRQRLLEKPHLKRRLCLVPAPALRDFLVRCSSAQLMDSARQNLARRWPFACAQLELTHTARLCFILALALLVAILLMAPFFAPVLLIVPALLLLGLPAALRIAALVSSDPRTGKLVRPADEELPIYSVLVPLRNESSMVPQLFEALRALDYPPERLDIKFVVEARSGATLAAVQSRLGDPRFSLVPVPDAAPRTKPKALDFALPLCRGEHVVVYDAEDIPAPDQLWKAALRFRNEPDLMCLQAPLVIDNDRGNWLSSLFAGEYAGLFCVFLPALARWGLPVPLGGTSNHFRTDVLRELGGWDAFNVTEDADLGVRLARRKMRVSVLQSYTRELAPTRLIPWFGQRMRWMKGWMQTFIVHNRDPVQLFRDLGPGPFIAFQLIVFGMIVTPILHCGFTLVLLASWIAGGGAAEASPWTLVYLTMLLVGYGSAFAVIFLGLIRLGVTPKVLACQLLLPVYWFLLGLATVRAARELLLRPFYWFKSPHRPVDMQSPPTRQRIIVTAKPKIGLQES